MCSKVQGRRATSGVINWAVRSGNSWVFFPRKGMQGVRLGERELKA